MGDGIRFGMYRLPATRLLDYGTYVTLFVASAHMTLFNITYDTVSVFADHYGILKEKTDFEPEGGVGVRDGNRMMTAFTSRAAGGKMYVVGGK